VLGLGLVVYGYIVEQRVVFSLGVVTLVCGLVYQLSYAIQMFDLGSWGSLAILGISAILVGSAMERYGKQIKNARSISMNFVDLHIHRMNFRALRSLLKMKS